MNATLALVEPAAEPAPPTAEDLELAERVRFYLARTGHRPLRLLAIEAQNGVVRLQGEVPSYYLRQLAIACQYSIPGLRCLIDEIQTRGR